jgi:hypothetical protein
MPPARFKVAGELGELPVVLCRYEVTGFVVVIGTPRTPHGVVCCATRLVPPRKEVSVDPPQKAVRLVHHLELFDVRVPGLTR